jgi:hypothetical protein
MEKTVTLQFSQLDNGEFKVVKGISSSFASNQTFIIDNKKSPHLFWNIIYNMIGLPLPGVPKPEKDVPVNISTLEKELSQMTASEIVTKVLGEKNIEIKISRKSKSAIIRKAIQIYSSNNPLIAS